MGLPWAAALIFTSVIGAVIAVDAIGMRRKPARWIGLLGLATSVWAGSELLLALTVSERELLWGRRALFAAVCAIGPLMLCAALDLHSRRVRRALLPVLLVIALIEAACYGVLLGQGSDLFIAGASGERRYGPAFYVHAGVAWLALGAAIVLFAVAAWRAHGAGRIAAALAIAGGGAPIALNLIFVVTGWPGADPGPVAAALGALSLRFGAIELLGREYLTSHARSFLLDHVDAGVLVADAHGRVLEANEPARVMLGGRDPARQSMDGVRAALRDTPGFIAHEFPIERRGAVVGRGLVVLDRRAAHAREKQLQVESHLRALGIVAHGLAHEINNPLVSVLGSAELMRFQLGRLPDGAVKTAGTDLTSAIELGAERIREVVARMDRLATPVTALGSAECTDVAEVVGLAAQLASLGKPASAVSISAPPHAVANARAAEVLEILFHVIQNAVEASGEAASVEVRVEADADVVRAAVLDRGPGLPAEVAEVFSPFFTTRRPGRLGLGLSLSWELARKNSGGLDARPRAGGGAEFVLTLPAAAAQEAVP